MIMVESYTCRNYCLHSYPLPLSKSPWFSSLTPEELNQLASLATLLSLGPNAIVFREVGDPGDALYVVVTGLVRILVATTSGELAEHPRSG